MTRKIIRSKTGFLYEGLKTAGDPAKEEEDYDAMLEGLGAASRRRRGGAAAAAEEREKCELNPQQLMDHFRAVYSQDPELLNCLFPVFRQANLPSPTDLFFLEILAVPPPRWVLGRYCTGSYLFLIFSFGWYTLHRYNWVSIMRSTIFNLIFHNSKKMFFENEYLGTYLTCSVENGNNRFLSPLSEMLSQISVMWIQNHFFWIRVLFFKFTCIFSCL